MLPDPIIAARLRGITDSIFADSWPDIHPRYLARDSVPQSP